MNRPTADSVHLASLLERVATGDTGAFEDFYDQTSGRVYGVTLRVVRDEGYAEEVAQEVYAQVWRGASSYRPEKGSVLAWVIAIAHRRAVDRVRVEQSIARRESDYGARQLITIADEVGDEVQARDAGRRVRQCLSTLTALQAQAVGLAYYEGLTYREVAERLAVGLPAVKSRIRDGLTRLRGCLES